MPSIALGHTVSSWRRLHLAASSPLVPTSEARVGRDSHELGDGVALVGARRVGGAETGVELEVTRSMPIGGWLSIL